MGIGNTSGGGTDRQQLVMNGNIAIIFAGGTGRRMNDTETPKQFIELGGKPVVAYTLEHFERHGRIDAIYAACLEGYEQRLEEIAERHGIRKLCAIVPGGDSAQDSIYRALTRAAQDWGGDSLALIHDAVRPIIEGSLIDRLIDACTRHGNAVACAPANETCVLSSDGATVDAIPDRSKSFRVQAPQAFRLRDILVAHEAMRTVDGAYGGLVCSASLMQRFGHQIHLVQGAYGNIKITYPDDIAFFAGWLAAHGEGSGDA
ncbi:MAG: 2-C-methyl-D-erythritol 4-phosphate cytidylyltransferase [Clostridiales Family XIII bacterium]|jgi:2-C-methyl-D-erythritol 4-phosphate cytidylyltransferase|nr:2-C-methyl-D-erythritol 4-phosphate cytidylyltransferase [Clostridiales Family XIII bacterium]